MALKLGKCRLCLKLGDFFSIFTLDSAIQLSEMVMECARVKIYEGDGLPDKICSECVQKLSGAYIFKQQCERSDQELRRNYVPPPGFSITPPPPNRQSSDSAFSSLHADISSHQTKAPSSSEKVTPAKRTRKRSHGSIDNGSVSSQSHDSRPTPSKRVEELRKSQKRSRGQSPNMSMDSDYEDYSNSQFSGETDSDEPLIHTFKCKQCDKEYKTVKSLSAHMKVHSREKRLANNAVVDIPKNDVVDARDVEDKLHCEKCLKTFKLKIMLKRHLETCGKTPQKPPQKELLISLQPIDAVLASKYNESKKIECELCTTRFKTVENLEKHMRVVHAAMLKKERKERITQRMSEVTQYLPDVTESTSDVSKLAVPCLYCGLEFEDYYIFTSHMNSCSERDDSIPFECSICKRLMSKRASFYLHIKNIHFWPREPNKNIEKPKQEFECRMCNKKLASQDLLITHLASHMSNVEEMEDGGDEESRPSTPLDATSIHSDVSNTGTLAFPVKCDYCDKTFKYKKALETHKLRHTHGGLEVKSEPPDKPSTSLLEETYPEESESDSSGGEGDDNTCDICEKQFSYKRLLLHHKRTKHNMSSGTKRAKINLKDCSVRCLICDVEMKVSSINEHNQKHITRNIKPRNQYTCAECGEQFKACSALANHIKLVHRLKQQPISAPRQFEGTDLADFCEVVVTKAEPLDEIQSHNGFGEVPVTEGALVDLAGFTCHLCGKKLKTLISLKRHVNWHLNVGNNIEKKIECFVCKEMFRFQCHYKLHMREHYRDPNLDPKLLTCTICGRRSKHLRAAQAHTNFHKQTRFKNKDYQCSICKRIFQYRKVYLSHMAIHYKRGEGQNTIVGDIIPNNIDKTVFDGTYTCPQCGKVCDSENSLKCHIRWHTSKSSLYGSRHECTICHLQFTNKRRLEIHTRAHYEDVNGPYKCTVCGKGYIDEDYFKRHVKSHNFDNQSHKKRIEKLRKGKVKCPICTRFYPDMVKLIRHLRRSHPESKMIKSDPDAPPPNYYTCKLCAKVFLDEKRLHHHEQAHLRKPEFFKCKFCGLKTISLKNHRLHVKQKHLTSKHLENPLKCPHCEETFIKGYDLHHHCRDVHNIEETWIAERSEATIGGPLKEFQCSICLKLLASKGNFERHLDYHNSLSCNYCSDYFSSLKFLEGHLAFTCDKKKLIGDTEVYPKKVKCHICYKAFHLQVKLDCHLRTQHDITVSKEASEGKQDFICDYCFKVFENDYALSMHKIYHRTIGYFGCIYCPRKFNTLTLYRKHKNHHFAQLNVDNPTKCEHCDETFVAFREMIYHMRDEHGDDKEWVVMPKDSIEEKCHICHKTFFNLHRHLSYHEDNRCKKCGEYFYSRIDFDQHLCSIESDEENENNGNIETKAAYEECEFCFKPVTRKTTKRLHDHMHKVSGAISCRFCPLKFKTMDAFNIHAFSHRSRKYNIKPIKCRICREKFVKYGPFMKHMKGVHKSTKKVHYRAIIKAERCVVCGDNFPNLHNHYRHHLQNQCQLCHKYFTSVKVLSKHLCGTPDTDPSKVYTSDENLSALINTYVPKDERDDEKFYGYTDDEEEEEIETQPVPELYNNTNQNSVDDENLIVQPFIISDVLSLYEKKEELLALYQNNDNKTTNNDSQIRTYGNKHKASNKNGQPRTYGNKNKARNQNGDDGDDSDIEIVNLSDDSMGVDVPIPTITIDD